MNQEEVIHIFKKSGAMMEGHFVLTSGYHSPHYFQCARVLQYPEYNTAFSKQIANHFSNHRIDAVISPAVGGIVLGTEVGRILNVKTIFAERENGKMVLRRGFEIRKDERILVCEDVVTTGGSVFEVIDLIREFKASPIGVGFIIDRSNGKVNFSIEQFSLARIEVIKFAENEIPDWLAELPITKPGSRKLNEKS
jgi:orotate phosphoribosyltransferase